MKINLGIIKSELESKYIGVDSYGEMEVLNIEDVKLVYDQKQIFNNYSLYIGTWDNFKLLDKIPKNIICLTNNRAAISYIQKSFCNAIFIGEGENILEVYSYVQDIFSYYRKFKYRMLKALADSKSSREVNDILSELLGADVIVYSKYLNVMGKSEGFVNDDIKLKENSILKNIQKLSNQSNFKKDREIYIITKHISSEASGNMMISRVDKYGELFAIFVILERDKLLSKYHENIINYFLYNMSTLLISLYTPYQSRLKLIRQPIESMLNGKHITKSSIKNTLHLLNWEEDDSYVVLSTSLKKEYIYEGLTEYLGKCLSDFISVDSISVIVDRYIVVIGRYRKNEEIFLEKTPEMNTFIESWDLRCGVSPIFNSFFELRDFFRLSTIALKIGSTLEPDKMYYKYSDYFLGHIIHQMSKEFSLENICHPEVKKINRRDKDNNENLLESLKYYLLYESNLLKASEHLFIHRNTLAYRIEKIKANYNLNLEDPKERLYILISSIIILDSKSYFK